MSNNKFWTDDISQIFAFDSGIIPSKSKTLNDNLNSITRIAIILCILIAAFKPLLALSTFCIVIVVVLAVYFTSQSVKPSADGYTTVDDIYNQPVNDCSENSCRPGGFNNPNAQQMTFDEDYVSKNQSLLGPPNPKTLVPPILPPTPFDLDAWRSSDLTIHSGINDDSNFDMTASGYNVTSYGRDICAKCSACPCRCIIQNSVRKAVTPTINTLQPGVYQTSVLSEPINALSGIGMSQNFESTHPVPITFGPSTPVATYGIQPPYIDTSDVYDPRFEGYGPSDRAYIEPVTGEMRYFYDDINAIRMPNYIVRNNVDVSVPDKTSMMGLNDYKNEADDKFKQAQLLHRTSLQERFMRKRDSEQWQQRVGPITTHKR